MPGRNVNYSTAPLLLSPKMTHRLQLHQPNPLLPRVPPHLRPPHRRRGNSGGHGAVLIGGPGPRLPRRLPRPPGPRRRRRRGRRARRLAAVHGVRRRDLRRRRRHDGVRGVRGGADGAGRRDGVRSVPGGAAGGVAPGAGRRRGSVRGVRLPVLHPRLLRRPRLRPAPHHAATCTATTASSGAFTHSSSLGRWSHDGAAAQQDYSNGKWGGVGGGSDNIEGYSFADYAASVYLEELRQRGAGAVPHRLLASAPLPSSRLHNFWHISPGQSIR
jgi:hypothetical protein